jgi:pyruvate formate lyase activating enzyme
METMRTAATEPESFLCDLCPHGCRIRPGGIGMCRARGVPAENADGVKCLNYGKVTSLVLDPIEKKPLTHFFPGSRILSVGSFGCNLCCPFCQNHEIATAQEGDVPTRTVLPEMLADEADRLRAAGNIGLAFTYNEPLVGFEFVADTARLIHARGMKNVLVTNGFLNPGYLEKLLPLIDAMNIDLKAFRTDFYRKIGGELETVKQNIRLSAARCHVELTCLLIDGENDTENEMEAMTEFIAGVSKDIPLHISRFFPRHKYEKGHRATNIASMRRFAEIARKRLSFVELGNV